MEERQISCNLSKMEMGSLLESKTDLDNAASLVSWCYVLVSIKGDAKKKKTPVKKVANAFSNVLLTRMI